jgi:aminoglycoside phosphotransferase (APT) family kinase protein
LTLLDASVSAADSKLLGAPSIRSGLVAAMTDKGLIRIAVGPSRRQLEGQSRALELLQATGPEAPVAERAPWVLASGKSGLAEWSLERRLAGSRPTTLTDPLRAQCLDFLVALHAADGSDTTLLPSKDAESIAVFRPERRAALTAVGSRLDAALADVPRGFGHGDFFLGNLLTDGDHLSGVVDWDAGGPGRLPLLDLIHLQHLAQYSLADEDWGPSLVRHLVPWAQSGGDDVARTYCSRIGLELRPGLLENLAAAYWLDRTAYTLRTHRQRRTEPRWLARNVDHVLEAVA